MSDSYPSALLRHRKLALRQALLIAGVACALHAVSLSIELPSGSGAARLIAITVSAVNAAFFLWAAWYDRHGRPHVWFSKLARAAFFLLPIVTMIAGGVATQRTGGHVISDVVFFLVLLVGAVIALTAKRQPGK
ncbi:hypothetical protein [Actinomadura hibisca]|uniref:hypothetical protein n=1 Tax=Actinomadura hibisca TaxID=68565 RepID=UPI00082F3EBD|nr:hypothetical protein [Actinomadura hibisca]